MTAQQIKQVRLRYEAFFGQTRSTLDGSWTWEDTNAAYFLLDSLTLREETAGVARMIFEDFAHYFTTRKPRSQFALLIVDEFFSLAEGAEMAQRIEQARGFNTALVLAPQVVAGMGDESRAARILGSVETVVCHRVNTPEEICSLAGTRKTMEYSTHYATEGATGEGSARIQHQFKVDPNKVRALPPGAAYVISRGRAMKVQILQAPDIHGVLPEPANRTEGQTAVPSDLRRSKEAKRLGETIPQRPHNPALARGKSVRHVLKAVKRPPRPRSQVLGRTTGPAPARAESGWRSLCLGRRVLGNRASYDQRAAIRCEYVAHARAVIGVEMSVCPRFVQFVVFCKTLQLACQPLKARHTSREPAGVAYHL